MPVTTRDLSHQALLAGGMAHETSLPVHVCCGGVIFGKDFLVFMTGLTITGLGHRLYLLFGPPALVR